MAAARGDTKPCSVLGSAGAMQFGRRADDEPQPLKSRRTRPSQEDVDPRG